MKDAIKCIVASVADGWTDYEDNEWQGVDVRLENGGTLRVAREGGEGEDVELFKFDGRMMLEWKASFSASVPMPVVAAAVRAAIENGGAG